jgi:ubiquinone/menaquinone biosynthesis C-methylase UbiE
MSFEVSGDAYDRFMGRYSRELAPVFADFAGVEAGQRGIDVGCGSGVLTEELARRLGADHVAGADPSPLLQACGERVPGAELKQASAESLPWMDDAFDAALAQLVVHFMDDPAAGAAEMQRVTRPGGTVAACTWDFGGEGMAMLGLFWQSVRAFEPGADAETSPFGQLDRLEALWRDSGLAEVEAEGLEVSTRYDDFDELWGSFLLGVGPAGQYALSLPPDRQAAVRDEYFRRLGEPAGSFTLGARAWAVRGVVPE